MLEQFEKQSTPEVLSYVSYIYMANGSSCTKSQKHLLAFNLWTRILSAVILQVNQVKDKDASWKRNTMHTCRRKLSWLIDARYLFPLLFLLFIVFAKLLDLFRSKLAEKWVDLAVGIRKNYCFMWINIIVLTPSLNYCFFFSFSLSHHFAQNYGRKKGQKNGIQSNQWVSTIGEPDTILSIIMWCCA